MGQGTVVHTAKIYNFDTVLHTVSAVEIPSGWSTDLSTSTPIVSGSYVEFSITLLDASLGTKDGTLTVTTYMTLGGTPQYYDAQGALIGAVGTIYDNVGSGGATGGTAAKFTIGYRGRGGARGNAVTNSAIVSYVRGPIWTAGGATVFGAGRVYDIEGGVEVGGLSENTRDIIPVPMTGGVVASATASVYDIEGGVIVSGLSETEESVYITGGCIVSGTASAYDIEGGATLDGTSDVSLNPADIYAIGGARGRATFGASISLNRTNEMSGGLNHFPSETVFWLAMYPPLPESPEENYAVVGGEAGTNYIFNEIGVGGVDITIEVTASLNFYLPVVANALLLTSSYDQNHGVVFSEPTSDTVLSGIDVLGVGPLTVGFQIGGGADLTGEASWLFAMAPPVSGGLTNGGGESPTTMSMSNITSGGLEPTRGAKIDYAHFFPKIKTGVGRCFNNDSIVKTREAELAASRRGRLITTLYDVPEVTNAFSPQHAPTWCYTNEKCDAVLPNCVIQRQGPYLPAKNRGFISTATSIATTG